MFGNGRTFLVNYVICRENYTNKNVIHPLPFYLCDYAEISVGPPLNIKYICTCYII